MLFSAFNIRKTVTYVFIGILFLGFYEYFWSDLPSFWQKIVMIITAIYLFSLIKDFVFWLFSGLSSFWSFLFKSVIVLLGVLLVWFCIFTDFSDNDFKENHFEIRNDVRNFFSLPTSLPFAKNEKDVLIVPSAHEIERDSVVDLLLNNTSSIEVNRTKNVENPSKEIKEIKEIKELKYENDAEKNWKIAIQKELYIDEDLVFSRKFKSKIDITSYKPTATVASGVAVKNSENYLLFTKTPVQVVYPQGYIFENKNWNTIDEKTGLVEEITVDIKILETNEIIAKAKYQIYASGELFDKYHNEFIFQPSTTSNTFFIESTTLNEVKYVTFFAGKCWVITFTKDGKNNILDDFYKVLIPAIFEAQD